MSPHACAPAAQAPARRTVLFVANTAFSLYNFRRGVMQALLERGYRVVAAAPHDSYADKLRRMGVEYLDLPMSARGANPAQEIALLVRLTRLCRQLRPMLVFNFTIKPTVYGTLAARLAGVPSIAVMTGLGYAFLHRNWVTWMARGLLRLAYRFAREVWTINPDDAQVLRDTRMVQPQRHRQLPGEGVDLDHFQAAGPHEGAGICFLLVARMLRDKGVVEFVEAARLLKPRYPQARFQLLGPVDVANPTAIPRATVEAWVAQGLVEYLGVTEDVRPYVAASDGVVLPSYREGVPRTLLEASAMARPIVTADSPGCRDVVVDGRTGYLCRPRDAQDLADKLELLIRLPADARMQMGRDGREFVAAKFDERRVIDIYLACLADVQENPGGRA